MNSTKEEKIRTLEAQLEQVRERQAQQDQAEKEDQNALAEAMARLSVLAPEPISAPDPTPTTPEEKKIAKEIKNLSPEEKQKIGWGLRTIGFKVEQTKDNFFAAAFNPDTMKGINKKGTVGRFCRELRDSFIRDAKIAERKAKEVTSGKEKHKLSNAAFLTKNVLKYTRLVFDATGVTVGAAQRIAMTGAMAFTRLAEVGKETRLKNEVVIEKTRIGKTYENEENLSDAEKKEREKDIARAEEEAWKIYGNAKKSGIVSAESLKNAYMMEMPKDLQKRLEVPATANNFIQRMVKRDIQIAVSILNTSIEKIEKNPKLSDQQKEAEKEKLLKGAWWQKSLADYDRIVTQYGTVDVLGMAGRYTQTAGKAVVAGLAIETALIATEKMWGALSRTLSSYDIHPVDSTKKFTKGIFNKITGKNIPVNPPAQNDVIADLEKSFKDSADATAAAELEKAEAMEIKPEAIIGKGKGIEHALKRQIAGNMEMAKALGYKEGMDLKKFSEGEAHRMAIRHGYVDSETGEEIRVRGNAGEVAYRARLENGEIKIEEFKMKDGKFSPSDEIHGKDSPFEGDKKEDYEYRSRGGGKKIIEPVAVKVPVDTPVAPVETAAPATTPVEAHADTQAQVDAIRENINQKIEAANNKVTMGTTIQTGTTVGTGDIPTPGRGREGYNINFRGNDFWPQGGGGEIMYHGYNIEGLPKVTATTLHNILETHPEFAGNPYDLTPQQLIEVYDTNRENLIKVFPEQTWVRWDMFDEEPASRLLNTKDADIEDGMGPFVSYLRKLREIAGEPKWSLIKGRETTEEFLARGLQKVKALGKMGELKASIEK